MVLSFEFMYFLSLKNLCINLVTTDKHNFQGFLITKLPDRHCWVLLVYWWT